MNEPRSHATDAGGERGYSLAEILIVVALMALMVLFGGPAIGDSLRAYKVRSSANELTTIIRALRYNAVTNRTPRTLTLNDENAGTDPNSYSYVNHKGKAILIRIQDGVSLESASVSSITFNINGSTGQTAAQNVLVSMSVNSQRGDRYTVSVSPTGTVRSTYATYTP